MQHPKRAKILPTVRQKPEIMHSAPSLLSYQNQLWYGCFHMKGTSTC